MLISSVEIDKIINPSSGGNVLAEASVVFYSTICVHKIKIIKGVRGMFVAFPNYRGKDVDGKKHFVDIAHPTTQEIRAKVESAILDKYNEVIGSQ